MRKVAIRLLPFLFVLYVIAFLDRVNFSYAALGMNSDLGITAEVFGFLSGIFFIGYLLFEVPSNLILQRLGARVWIARIMISWGIVVIVTAAATDILQLAALRFILGVAEAGFFPGVILYITFWFRKKELAQAVALFMTALAVSNIIGAPVSTYILDNIHWLGIESWRWLFVIEGLPAILLGILTWFYLTDRPEGAGWLEPQEKMWLKEELDREQAEQNSRSTGTGPWAALADWRIWYLSLIFCTLTIGLYGFGFWMPQIIQSLNPGFSNFEIGLVMMLPFIAAGIAMIGWSRHSDSTGERRWHAALPPLVGGISLVGAGLVSNPVAAFLFLVMATVGIYCTFGPFWTLPAVFCAGTGAAT
ncbi:MAG: MFS transporter, partial [Methanoregula sp.]|nr:MFS transporter [Methanoregula sp.]